MKTIIAHIVDSDYQPIVNAQVTARSDSNQQLHLEVDAHRRIGRNLKADRVTFEVSANGFERQVHAVRLHTTVNHAVIGLQRPGQLSYHHGHDRPTFTPIDDSFLMRIRGDGAIGHLRKFALQFGLTWKAVSLKHPVVDDDCFIQVDGVYERIDLFATTLKAIHLDVMVFSVIAHGNRSPLGLSNEVTVRFVDGVTRHEAEQLASSVGMTVARILKHAGNGYLLIRTGRPNYDILKAVDTLARNERVVYAEPNLMHAVETDQFVPNDPLFPQVPHLKLIRADHAWSTLGAVSRDLRGGSPSVVIAIVDPQGVAPNHPDLTANLTDGSSKLISSTNFSASPIVPQTVAGLSGDHGTMCASSATAAFNDHRGLPGVAPNCRLLAARFGAAVNATLMADIYMWLGGFLNGSTEPGFPAAVPSPSADIISSSWGRDGYGLSNSIRDCFDFLTTNGRSGKGCILVFSTGNPGYTSFTDATGTNYRSWPSYEKTLAVGASISLNPTNPVASLQEDPNGNFTGIPAAVDTRSLFSPYGSKSLLKPDLVAPSHTAYKPTHDLIDPILAAVPVGSGTVDGCPRSSPCKDYGRNFGGTSHSAPTVAGAVALILSARPNLTWMQVRTILRKSCVRIDPGQTNSTGIWIDLNGDRKVDFSRWYGFGRLDVASAVQLALDEATVLTDSFDATAVPNTTDSADNPAEQPA